MKLTIQSDIENARAAALTRIDKQAEMIRARYITTEPGQVLVYEQKRREATEAIQLVEPDPNLFPHIAVEAERQNISMLEAAQYVLTIAAQWTQMSALIERERLGAKDRVTAATTIGEIAAIRMEGFNNG